jgi:hypothetical protein
MKQSKMKTAGPSARKQVPSGPISTEMINQEQVSNQKNGHKFNIIKSMDRIE